MNGDHVAIRLGPVADREPRMLAPESLHVQAGIERRLHKSLFGRRPFQNEIAGSTVLNLRFAAKHADLE